MRHANAARTGRALDVGASTGALAWKQQLGGEPFDSAVDCLGHIHLGTIYHSEFWSSDTWEYSFDFDGDPLFRPKVHPYPWGAAQGVRSAPLLDGQGRLVFNSTNGELVALDASSGKTLWTVVRNPGSTNNCGPAVRPDGTIVHQQAGAGLSAFSPVDGSLLWTNPQPSSISSAIAVAPNGDMAMGATRSTEPHVFPALYYIDADGSTRWSVSTQNGDGDTPTFGPDGTLYATIVGTKAYAPDGSVIWSVPEGAGTPALDSQGRLYVRLGQQVLVLEASTGTTLGLVTAPGTIVAGLALDLFDDLYLTTTNGWVASYAPNGATRFETQVCERFNTGPAIAGGRVIAAGQEGLVDFLYSVQ